MTIDHPTADSGDHPRDGLNPWYARCPDCGLVGPAGSADYVLAEPAAERRPDWSHFVLVSCMPCGTRYPIVRTDLLARDAVHTCPRCDADTQVPAAAAQVVCVGCALFAPGPAARADRGTAEAFRTTQARHTRRMQAAVRAAQPRPDLDGHKPDEFLDAHSDDDPRDSITRAWCGATPHPIDQPISTVATRDQHALMHPAVAIEDCTYRMLRPREQLRAQRFPDSYLVIGNIGEQTMQAGNAVSSNVAQWLAHQLTQVL